MEKDPFVLFDEWYKLADRYCEASAVSIATSNSSGNPSVRFVLLKGYDKRGFFFFSSEFSAKASDISFNPNSAMAFYWECIKRQVRLEGKIEKVIDEESDEYFRRRAKKSQIVSCVSRQSSIMDSLDVFLKDCNKFYEENSECDIPRPDFWVGFRLVPSAFEFWQEGENRCNIRKKFIKERDGSWKCKLLYP